MRAILAALAVALAFPAVASAQGSSATPTPTPTPTATATPPPAATLSLRTSGTLADRGRRVVVSGRPFDVEGTLRPYVKGEIVDVTVLRNGRRLHVLHPQLRRAAGGRSATFTVTIRRRTLGAYTVRAAHAASTKLGAAHSNRVRVHVISSRIASGHGGAAVRLLQRGLRRLHYAPSLSGVYDAATQRAVMAWRKVTHRPRVFSADRGVLLGVLAGRGAWRVRHPHSGHHVEADISLQVLALVDGRHVDRIEYMSSGKPSTPTVLGRFRVYRKTPGTNSEGMVDSSYFIRGYAIHGYASVPTYNASHGCLRVPIPDAAAIYNWIRIGDVVWVEP